MEDTKTRILAMIEKDFGSNIAELARAGDQIFFNHGDTHAREEDYLDSLDRTELVMACEDEFGIDIPDAIAATFKTLDELVVYVDTVIAGPINGAN